MKKLLIITLLWLISIPAFAQGVGFINYEIIFENYKFAQKTANEISAKEKYIRELIEYREKEYEKLESPVQKQKFETAFKRELEGKEKEFNEFKDKKEEEVYSRIHAVTEKIRLEKEFFAILDSRCVFSGGEDITKAVLDKLNENVK